MMGEARDGVKGIASFSHGEMTGRDKNEAGYPLLRRFVEKGRGSVVRATRPLEEENYG
jgi:hypothetical protein